MSRKLKKALIAQKQNTEHTKLEIFGTLGIPINGNRTVDVPGRNSFVYVKLRDTSNEVIQAFNNKVATSFGLPVVVYREGNRYIIARVNSERYESNWNNSAAYLPTHGSSHSFPEGGGADVAWIFSRQFVPLLVYPSTDYSGTVIISPHTLLSSSGDWRYVGNTGTSSLLPYIPSGSNESAMVLVYLNTDTGNPGLLVGSGTPFSNIITGTQDIYRYIPHLSDPSTQLPLAAIRINTGTLSIGWDNIYDVRQWLQPILTGTSSQGGGGSAIGFVGQNKGVYLASGTTLNVNGTRLSMSVSGTVFNLTNSPDPYDNIGIYGVGLGTGTSLSLGSGLSSSITGTTLYASINFGTGTNQVASGDRGVTNGDSHDHNGGDGGTIAYTSLSNKPTAETNSSDIFRVDSPGGVSAFAGTIATLPGGATLTYNVSSGQEGAMVPTSTSQLAKMRLYNTTRGTSALISNCVTGTNTITLTANVPAGWQVGDTITIASQTVSGTFSWIDLEITSGLTGKSYVIMSAQVSSTSAASDGLRLHPFTTFASTKVFPVNAQELTSANTGTALVLITSNVFSLAWTGSPTAIVLREQGYFE